MTEPRDWTREQWQAWMAGRKPNPPRPCRLGEPPPMPKRDWKHKPVRRSANLFDYKGDPDALL